MDDREICRTKFGFNSGAHCQKGCFVATIITVLIHYEYMCFDPLNHT
jgi:hypothetical protein